MAPGRPWWKKGRYLLAAPVVVVWISWNVLRRQKPATIESGTVEADKEDHDARPHDSSPLVVLKRPLPSEEDNGEFDERRLVRRGRFVPIPNRHD